MENVNNKPKITSAVYKNRAFSKGSIDALVDGPLLSDLYVTDPIQEEQIRLGNNKIINTTKPLLNPRQVSNDIAINDKMRSISKKCDNKPDNLNFNVASEEQKKLRDTTSRNDDKDLDKNIKIVGPIEIDKNTVDVRKSESKCVDYKLDDGKLNKKDTKKS